MERENMFMNETNNFLLPYSMAMQNEVEGTSEQVQNCFFNPNWNNSVDQNDTFESALSSMVSSPVTSNAPTAAAASSGENIVLRELIGRLGSICNSGEVSPHSWINGNNNSTTNSCYSTPLNSPPKLNLTGVDHQMRGNLGNLPYHGSHLPSHPSFVPIEPEPGFAERAARFSCFANTSLQRIKVEENKDVSSLQVDNKSSLSDQMIQIPGGKNGMNCQKDANLRKRKSIPKGKGKDVPSSTSSEEANVAAEKNESTAKRCKSDDNENGKDGDLKGKKNGNKKENKDDEKPDEPFKDYIHVRARRGQATDAHSLAERVRREKISKRMKFLQDLVPGCNKVTGKAVMLDEIINYVQSLQRQVEFLSMKLATINPGMNVNIEALLSSKDMLQACGSLPSGSYSPNNSPPPFPFLFQCQQIPNLHGAIPNEAEMPLLPSLIDINRCRSQSMQVPIGNYSEAATQDSTVWEDDLQSVVFGQNPTHNFCDAGLIGTETQMKTEQ